MPDKYDGALCEIQEQLHDIDVKLEVLRQSMVSLEDHEQRIRTLEQQRRDDREEASKERWILRIAIIALAIGTVSTGADWWGKFIM